MEKYILFFFVIAFFSCNSKPPQSSEEFKIKRGTNIAHWISQSNRRGVEREQFFTKTDVGNIAKMGFDHIRLPIDEVQMWDENGNRNKEAFQLMTNCIDWCCEYDLHVIVDLHILRSHYFGTDENELWTDPLMQDKFCFLWEDLSNALAKYPNSLVAYELLNEPVAENHQKWNDLIKKSVKIIRKMEPKRTIVIGSNTMQKVYTFNELWVPENDPNIILSFHFYEPMALTHYEASWTILKDYHGPIRYPGVILTQEIFDDLLKELQKYAEGLIGTCFNKEVLFEKWPEAINKAKRLGLPLYCGEFGVVSAAPKEDRLNWYKDVIQLFEESGISYSNWNYKSNNFGLINDDGSRNEELIKIVLGK